MQNTDDIVITKERDPLSRLYKSVLRTLFSVLSFVTQTVLQKRVKQFSQQKSPFAKSKEGAFCWREKRSFHVPYGVQGPEDFFYVSLEHISGDGANVMGAAVMGGTAVIADDEILVLSQLPALKIPGHAAHLGGIGYGSIVHI